MTNEEVEVLDLLGEAATAFASLPTEHTADLNEFVLAIHAAQNIVLSRAGLREYRVHKGLRPDWKKEPL